MAARALGTVSSTSRFHFRVRCGGVRTSTRWKPRSVGCGCADEGLAGAHLPHDVGALVGLEGEGDAPYGVCLGSQGGAEQLGEAVTVLGGPVEGRVGLHHPLGDG